MLNLASLVHLYQCVRSCKSTLVYVSIHLCKARCVHAHLGASVHTRCKGRGFPVGVSTISRAGVRVNGRVCKHEHTFPRVRLHVFAKRMKSETWDRLRMSQSAAAGRRRRPPVCTFTCQRAGPAGQRGRACARAPASCRAARSPRQLSRRLASRPHGERRQGSRVGYGNAAGQMFRLRPRPGGG